MASTLTKVALGLGVAVGGLALYGWWRSRKASGAACNTPLTTDELTSPRGQRMMALYGECVSGGSACTETELASLLEYLNSLCPDTDIERAWLQATKDSLRNVRAVGQNVPLINSPNLSRFFSSGEVHVGGCGCEACATKTGHDEPCCAACALGQPCTGACARKKEPQTVGRA